MQCTMDTNKGTGSCTRSVDEYNMCRHKLVVDLLREVCMCNSKMERPLRDKLRKILSDVDIALYLTLHTDSTTPTILNTNNILGIASPVLEELTFSEQKLLQAEIEKYIMGKYPKQFVLYDELISGSLKEQEGGKDIKKSVLSVEQVKLLELSEVYISKLNQSAEQLTKMCNMMVVWIDKRIKDAVDRAAVTAQYYQLKNKLLESKAKIIEIQLSLSVYGSNSSGLAYMEINKDITKKMDALRSEVLACRKILSEDL